MNDISIVTAFFDIGRGGWTADKGLPPYLQRTTQTYLERFGHLAKLENEMVVYTSQDMVRAIQSLRQGRPTVIVTLDFPNSFTQLRRQISEVQNNPEYQKQINPRQARNPEYWNADYVIVNALKSFFVKKAIESGCLHNELCAWLDFGYCREESALHGIRKWRYPFARDRIHLFNLKNYAAGTSIRDIIANNDVHITGPCIVAGQALWPELEALVNYSMGELLKNNLIDDD